MNSAENNSLVSVFKGKKGKPIMLVDPELIKHSVFDLRKNIRFPKEMTCELAEEIGIHLGDGCLRYYENAKQKGYAYSVSSGHDERAYLENVIIPLMKNLYNLVIQISNSANLLIKTSLTFSRIPFIISMKVSTSSADLFLVNPASPTLCRGERI